MSSPASAARAAVTSAGRFALDALRAGPARAIAVFERSAYVETPSGLACLGAVGDGPLNAQCALPSGLTLGAAVDVDLSNAIRWFPRPAPPWNGTSVERALVKLDRALEGRLPVDGLAHVLGPAEAPPAVRALSRWIADPSSPLQEVRGLIGLGPGLTPSGDDLVGGALCALHAVKRVEDATRLSDWALPIARNETGRISHAHLACAAEGECSAVVNEAIVALLSGQVPDLAGIDAVGHTSGWDALAGVTLVLHVCAQPP